MRIWDTIFGPGKTKPVFAVYIEKMPSGQWSFRHDFKGDHADGEDVLISLLLHIHAVADQTGRDGMAILADLQAVADANMVGFAPAFEGVKLDEEPPPGD